MTEQTVPTEPAFTRNVADITATGVFDDPDLIERLARILTVQSLTVDTLPTTDIAGAAELFANVTPLMRIPLGDLIAVKAEHGSPGWPGWLVDAMDGVSNNERIGSLREDLDDALQTALKALDHARRTHEKLINEFDSEHAENTGGLFPHYLTEAHRALRTAIAVNPTKPERK